LTHNSGDPQGMILLFGTSDFPHFVNMAARRNYTRTSTYRAIVGLTKRSPV